MMKISALRTTLSRVSRVVTTNKSFLQGNALRSFSTQGYDKFVPTAPSELTVEMAEGISDATQFYLRHGVSKQRLVTLSRDTELPAVNKWQNMMEIFLTTQVHVIAGLGYDADERGLTKYAQHLSECLQQADDDIRDLFTEIRRDTWRELVAAAFDLQPDELQSVSIVEARNIMHKVSSKMVSPEVLEEIKSRCTELPPSDVEEHMLAEKHRVLQHVIVHSIYLAGNPSLVEEAGFGSGDKAYAKIQCALSDHEGDPLINEYAAAAMAKVWEAAGLPLNAGQGAP
eukprot:scaffold17669_cov140-Amphora_coffeaeformis.AAC.1